MVNRYNFYNLEASFREYLIAGNVNPISIKNYLSDLRHFFGWLTFYLESHNNLNISVFFATPVLLDYKSYLVGNKIPDRTVNRRLSTLRKFGSFCISQGWLKENPAKTIQNVKFRLSNQSKSLLTSFTEGLKTNNFDETVIKDFQSDIKEFLDIIDS